MGDHDIEGTSTEWGIKITPPGKMPAPYYRAFASKQAAQAEIARIADLPCELAMRSVTTGAWHDAARNPTHVVASSVAGREVDAALTIYPFFAGNTDFAFDAALGTLDGCHPPVVNHVSDRAYYFLEGAALVTVGESTFDVAKGDLVTVPAGTPHSVAGAATYLVITSPPFDPRNETPAAGA